MWCAQCMQDVPVLPGGTELRCGRCQGVLSVAEQRQPVSAAGEPGASPCLPSASSELLGHQLDLLEIDLLQTRCELAAIQAALQQEPEDWQWLWASEGYLRWDAHSVAVRGPRCRSTATPETAPEPETPAPQAAPLQTAARYAGELLIYLAAMFFSLGGVLAAWAHWGGREQFWPIAWPALAGSAAGLMLGVLLRAWAGPPPAGSSGQKDAAAQVPRSRPLGPHRADQPGLHAAGPHWSPTVEAVSELGWEGDATEAEPSAGTSR